MASGMSESFSFANVRADVPFARSRARATSPSVDLRRRSSVWPKQSRGGHLSGGHSPLRRCRRGARSRPGRGRVVACTATYDASGHRPACSWFPDFTKSCLKCSRKVKSLTNFRGKCRGKEKLTIIKFPRPSERPPRRRCSSGMFPQ
ncbi:hypothetical protein BRADI_4g23795v3 [Brachypodium distachyon]|uniref:Uncharacterized protein n=1 Tax=Brachypodium distachyon TaxID=15368 RepID=A0A2K2CPW7_BRADI|nr:hypothetical protein BRADI_4g23795v3 [Brachypodium distachyon]